MFQTWLCDYASSLIVWLISDPHFLLVLASLHFPLYVDAKSALLHKKLYSRRVLPIVPLGVRAQLQELDQWKGDFPNIGMVRPTQAVDPSDDLFLTLWDSAPLSARCCAVVYKFATTVDIKKIVRSTLSWATLIFVCQDMVFLANSSLTRYRNRWRKALRPSRLI